MSAKQKAKHIADRQPQPYVEKPAFAGPTPDGLGAWEGGIAHRSIDGAKAKPQRTGDTKNRPGIDYASKITHRQDRDFNEIHVEDGVPMLYNVYTDAWDIKGDSADIPYYTDADGLTWAFDTKSGRWDVPVEFEVPDAVAPLLIEESDNVPCSDNIDTCLVCGTEIPPGPDFCSEACEAKVNNGPTPTA